MISAPLPPNEEERLAALKNYQIDKTHEQDFDEVVELASQICGTPLALISLVDKDCQWFKAKSGDLEANETEREIAFCSHAILGDDVFVIPDAREDIRFHDNPLVQANVIRYYAGAPLESEQGERIGTLCVIDHVPRELSESQLFALKVLSKQVMNQIELRAKMRQLAGQMEATEQAYTAEENAKKEAKRANQAQSMFFSHMGHEMRTPLHGILGVVEILDDTELLKDQKGLVSTLKKSSNNLLNIINDVLDFSKIDSGNMLLARHPFNLLDVINTFTGSFTPEIDRKGIAFELEIITDFPSNVFGDAVRLRQILNNLLSNAIKYTEKGKVRLKLEKISKTQEEIKIRFSICDTGPGIPAAKQKIIFEEFQQEEILHDTYGGVGLGTSIAKKLTELMGGKIGLISPLYESGISVGGPGTEFWIEIPFERVHQISDIDSNQAAKGTRIFPEGIKILVAEDNIVNQMLVRRQLEQLGLEIEMANNGQEALDLFSQMPFDLFLTDINMPEMDGMVTTKILRDTYKADIPIIAMTANAFDADWEKYRSMGMDDLIRKPFNLATLKEVLEKFIRPEVRAISK